MPAQIHYFTLQDETPRKEKLDWFRNNKLSDLEMERIHPDEKGNWLNITDNDFEDLLPLASKEVKGNKAGVAFDKAVFKLFSTGFLTGRDEWVTDFSENNLETKLKFYIEKYNEQSLETVDYDSSIKWSRNLKNRKSKSGILSFDSKKNRAVLYRPFVKKILYDSKILIDERGGIDIFFHKKNPCINFRYGSRLDFFCVSTDLPSAYAFYSLDPSQYLPLYRYDETGNRIENITDWGLEQFLNHYPIKITKEAIFHYVYAVLHNPAYRKKYEQNLKRDFPRIPFYDDFEQWATWGKALMDLHINYDAPPAPDGEATLKIIQRETPPSGIGGLRVKLKADKEAGTIEIDEQTTLTGVPTEAWAYKLGNRSALEWILDQYKESKPTDPTILEKFNHYSFADYKEEVIVLLEKVCAVSVETMKIIRAMETVSK